MSLGKCLSHNIRWGELCDIALDRNVASVVSPYIAVDSCSPRIAKTFNFGWMLPSAYKVPAMYDNYLEQMPLIIQQ